MRHAHLFERRHKPGPAALDRTRVIGSHRFGQERVRLFSRAAEQLWIPVRKEDQPGDDPQQQQAKVLHQWRPGESVPETRDMTLRRNQKSLVAVAVVVVRVWRRWGFRRAVSA